jgi:hypothetical protein
MSWLVCAKQHTGGHVRKRTESKAAENGRHVKKLAVLEKAACKAACKAYVTLLLAGHDGIMPA